MFAYLDALKSEIRLASKAYESFCADTVFIGGGTPSILPVGAFRDIFATLRASFCISENAEITIESNPGTLTMKKLDEYIDCGINRLSIGCQSGNDRLLKILGRIHTVEDFDRSVQLAKRAGFDNINADMMYGLPTQTERDVADTISMLAGHDLSHISAYSLILEDGTQLKNSVDCGELALPDEETEFAMHRTVIDTLKQCGYERYEISNYLKAGRECKHNLIYWDLGEYIGLGLAAHSAINMSGQWTRYANTDNQNSYVDKVKNGIMPIEIKQQISRSEEMFEFVMLGLRKISGISIACFEERFSCKICAVYGNAIDKLKREKLLIVENDSMRLSDRGLDIQNMVLAEFE